jgi:hypothetical protein
MVRDDLTSPFQLRENTPAGAVLQIHFDRYDRSIESTVLVESKSEWIGDAQAAQSMQGWHPLGSCQRPEMGFQFSLCDTNE